MKISHGLCPRQEPAVVLLMLVFHHLNDGDPDLLLEAAGKPLGVLLVQFLQLKARIDALLNGLPKSFAFGDCQGDVVHFPKITDYAV
jgi:hypothetical protein